MIEPQCRILLLRHGETEWNNSGRFQGALDSRLTAKGEKQADITGKLLAKIAGNVDAFFASPLGRVQQTTSIIRSHGNYPDVIWDKRLREVSIGSWDGLIHTDIDAGWPGSMDGSTAFDWYFRSPDGESYEAVQERVHAWLGGLSGVVVAVSHGLVGRIIRGEYLGLSRNDALTLPVPQDVIWSLHCGQVEMIA